MPPSHNFAAINKGAEKPAARPMTKRKMPSHTRAPETGSGSLGSNGGAEPDDGCAMMSASRDMFCRVSDWRIASNETEISHGRVSWQTRWTYFAMGPLASSIG